MNPIFAKVKVRGNKRIEKQIEDRIFWNPNTDKTKDMIANSLDGHWIP